MAKYRDKIKVGNSELCPFVPGEDVKARHKRRKNTNLKNAIVVGDACLRLGVTLKLYNECHHWQVTKGFKLIDWWPSSAKLVINKEWEKGIHCHDYKQFIKILENQF